MAENYYTILGVPQNASSEKIRSRFLELARTRHPDRFKGEDKAKAEREFQAITEAFNILSSPERRREHDQELAGTASRASQQADPQQVARVYLKRGVKAYRDKDYREAATNFDRATEEDPGSARAWHHLARALAHQRRYLSRAAAAIRRACELEPMNTAYLKVAGQLHAEAGMASRALQYYEEAKRWGADDPAIDQKIAELRKEKKGGGFFGKA